MHSRWIFAFLLFSGPGIACAQTQQPVTHAQVECELKALEGVGYRPAQEDYYYPRNLEAAQARLAQQNRARGLPPEGTCAAASPYATRP